MGTLSRLPWWRRPGRARARVRARTRSTAVGLGASSPTPSSATCRADSASACSLRARSCRTRRCCCSTSRSAGVDRPRRAAARALLQRARRRGTRIMVATHDLEQARAWDRVLCLNRRQVAFGRPPRCSRRRCWPRRTAREIVVDRRARASPSYHRTITTRCTCMLDSDPWQHGFMQRARARARPDRRAHRRARLLDRPLRALLQRRVARARALPRARRRHAARAAASARRRGGLGGRRARDRHRRGRSRAIGRDTAVAIVVTTLFGARRAARARTRLAARDPGPPVRRSAGGHGAATSSRRRVLCAAALAALAVLHRPLLGRRLRPRHAPCARRAPVQGGARADRAASPRRFSSRSRRSGTCSSSPSWSDPPRPHGCWRAGSAR